MTNIEFHEKTKEIISRFKDGERLFNDSALFNRVVQLLVRDVDIYHLLEQVIQNHEETMTAYTDCLLNSNQTIILKK